MNTKEFVEGLVTNRTKSGRARGLRCNITMDVYKDGKIFFYCKNGKDSLVNGRYLCIPAKDSLDAMHVFIDIISNMHKRARKEFKEQRKRYRKY